MIEPGPAVAAAALYAGLNALILLWLAYGVVRVRLRERISIGDAGNPRLIRAMRGMANFAEYAPMALILLFAGALLGQPAWTVHLLGLVFTLGRVAHAWHFLQADAPAWQRSGGALSTLIVLALGGLGVAAHALVWL